MLRVGEETDGKCNQFSRDAVIDETGNLLL